MSEQSLAEMVRKNSSPHSIAGLLQRKCDKCRKKKQPLQRRSSAGQSLLLCRISFMTY